MPAYIHRITTEVPDFAYSQDFARDRLKSWSQNVRTKRLIHALYNRSGIKTRHSVCGDFVDNSKATLFKTNQEGVLIAPSTADRNRLYTDEAKKLAVKLARRTLAEATDFDKADVTHVIFASCTGFANPGPDYHLIRELGLNPGTERYTLGFMGCYAAFPALRMAAQFCEANPKAVVLVMCLELCTLHMQINDQPDSILANSLFADGAAAAIVSFRTPAPDSPCYRMDHFTSMLLPSGEGDMAWEIGDEGFNIVLSSYVPEIIGSNIEALVENVLQPNGLHLSDIEEWAVHPGGRAILDKIENSLSLAPDALQSSREVLKHHGNMSSATILFVLKRLLESAQTTSAQTCAMAFGPGLTVETAVFERCGGPATLSLDCEDASHPFDAAILNASMI